MALMQETKVIIHQLLTEHNPVILVDMSNHMYKFAYVFRDMSIQVGSKEIPTGNIYGFLNMLTNMRKAMPKCGIVVVPDGYDRSLKEINSEYKAGRSHDVEVHTDTNDILAMACMLPNVWVSYHPEYEADSTIYSIAKVMTRLIDKNEIQGQKVVVYSNDKDLYQCVDHNVITARKLGKGMKWLIPEESVSVGNVKDQYNGVYPEGLALFRSLTGDSSDNIKGYLRFPKKIAEVFANDYNIHHISDDEPLPDNFIKVTDEASFGFVSKVDSPRPMDAKWFKVIQEEPARLKNNYAVMKLKTYDFTIYRVDTSRGLELVRLYRLSKYAAELEALLGVSVGSSYF
jgi:5'-3' exonuclease